MGESVAKPLDYYDNNTAGAVSLLKAMRQAGVHKLVFSSTCATYGEPEAVPIVENDEPASDQPLRQVEVVCRNRFSKIRLQPTQISLLLPFVTSMWLALPPTVPWEKIIARKPT